MSEMDRSHIKPNPKPMPPPVSEEAQAKIRAERDAGKVAKPLTEKQLAERQKNLAEQAERDRVSRMTPGMIAREQFNREAAQHAELIRKLREQERNRLADNEQEGGE